MVSTQINGAAAEIQHWDSDKEEGGRSHTPSLLLAPQLPYKNNLVDLGNKPAEFKALYASLNFAPGAPAKVPILIDGNVRLYESLVCLEYLAAKYADRGTPLLPADPAAAARARLFIETFSSTFTSSLFAVLRADSADALAAAKDSLTAALGSLDRRGGAGRGDSGAAPELALRCRAAACADVRRSDLAPAAAAPRWLPSRPAHPLGLPFHMFIRAHGSEEGGDYFLGGTYSLAEAGTVGFLQRGLAALPHFRGLDLRQLIRDQARPRPCGLDRLERWAEAALARPSSQQTRPSDDTVRKSWAKFVVEIKA
eukprot:scaffold22.g6102.t1